MTDPASDVPDSQTWKLTLSYDGTDFHGWQLQPGMRTVQGEVRKALGRVTGETPLPQGSGRTDAGVHALAQVASFALRARIPAENLHRALNRKLPGSIRILEAKTMPAGFHARRSAVAKTYEYRIFLIKRECKDICPPFLARYVTACSWPLDLTALNQAALHFVGEHDFCSLAASDPDGATRAGPVEDEGDAASTVRRVFSSAWQEEKSALGPLLVYRVRGNGFLHHMVRNLVGTMIEVGRGALMAAEIPGILAARSRSAAGPTSAARGLFLHSVEYEEKDR